MAGDIWNISRHVYLHCTLLFLLMLMAHVYFLIILLTYFYFTVINTLPGPGSPLFYLKILSKHKAIPAYALHSEVGC
jgi:hypothetical protein